MKVTQTTTRVLKYRRAVKKLTDAGYEQVELYRNWLQYPDIITDVVIGPDGTSLYWKKGTARSPALDEPAKHGEGGK